MENLPPLTRGTTNVRVHSVPSRFGAKTNLRGSKFDDTPHQSIRWWHTCKARAFGCHKCLEMHVADFEVVKIIHAHFLGVDGGACLAGHAFHVSDVFVNWCDLGHLRFGQYLA